MRSLFSARNSAIYTHQNLESNEKSTSVLGTLCKTILISGFALYFLSIFLFSPPNCFPSKLFFSPPKPEPWLPSFHDDENEEFHLLNSTDTPTNITHLVFGLLGSNEAWKHRKAYTESWWRPNRTRGILYLDEPPSPELLPWPKSSPPYRVSDDIRALLEETKHVAPIMVRMVHAIMELYRDHDREGVRWYVMGDDDSLFFVENWVRVLSGYDHNKFVYIGGQSEAILSGVYYSFDMGFGGAGFALSYPLVKAMAKDLENCFRRYPYLRSADHITMTCIADLGVPFTSNRGIHQIDLRGDISGFLSAHPQFPVLSLHHFDAIEPIFPNKERAQSLNHLMKAGEADQSRLLQQTVCYHRQSNWSFSVSWGYSVHLYEKVIPRSFLKIPLETFKPWLEAQKPYYIFNTRPLSGDSCDTPHVFFFDSIGRNGKDGIVTRYVRSSDRGLPPCSSTGYQSPSADVVSRIEVFTPAKKHKEVGKSECCDVVSLSGRKVAKVKFRACMEDEVIA